jgi:hypothetical protein
MKNLPHLKTIVGISAGGLLATLVLLVVARPQWLQDDLGTLPIALLLGVIPYVALCGVAALISFSVPQRQFLCLASLIVGIAGFVLHTLCLEGSCMSGFVIILAPLYQLIGVGVAVSLALLSKLVAYIDNRVAERKSKA